ncbi:MAG: nickel-dependent hydrogenase large subunit [Pseudomonadota bacterium]
MSFEGRVTIDVRRGEAPVVRVSFTQPGDVTRALLGKTPAEAQTIVPALYALCGKAQAHAARLALDAAEGRTPGIAELTGLQCLTDMESLRENTLRIALDWPRLLGERADPAGLKPLMRLVSDLESVLRSGDDARAGDAGKGFARDSVLRVIDAAERLLAELVFGEPLAHWQARLDADAVCAWAAQGRTPAGRLVHHIHSQGKAEAGSIFLHRLAPLDGHAVLAWLAAGSEQALPLMSGRPVPETTLLARHAGDRRLARVTANGQSGHGLWARLTARLIELSELPAHMRDLLCGRLAPCAGRALGEATGMGEVTAARGTLMHVAAVEDGRITRYRVLAPTRWNFDADGVASRAVESIAVEHGEDAKMLAELMVNAIDPCVAYSVGVH